jgi:hypothetical protein
VQGEKPLQSNKIIVQCHHELSKKALNYNSTEFNAVFFNALLKKAENFGGEYHCLLVLQFNE